VERGSSKWLSISRYNSGEKNSEACIDSLKAKGYQIVATTPHTDSTLDSFRPGKPMALVIGTEKQGVSKTILNKADQLLKIPMVGFTESLNLSVAAAICIHHIINQLRSSGMAWELTDEQEQEVLLDWCKKTVKNHRIYFKRFSELPKA
jgi:tRNA (guanosine-2'-O-)-methyltransferase